jgi:hypothetical protein
MPETPEQGTQPQPTAGTRPHTRRNLIVSVLADAIVELALADAEARVRRNGEEPPSHDVCSV